MTTTSVRVPDTNIGSDLAAADSDDEDEQDDIAAGQTHRLNRNAQGQRGDGEGARGGRGGRVGRGGRGGAAGARPRSLQINQSPTRGVTESPRTYSHVPYPLLVPKDWPYDTASAGPPRQPRTDRASRGTEQRQVVQSPVASTARRSVERPMRPSPRNGMTAGRRRMLLNRSWSDSSDSSSPDTRPPAR